MNRESTEGEFGILTFVKNDQTVEPEKEENASQDKPKTEIKTEDSQSTLETDVTESANSSKDTSLVDFAVTSAMPTMWLGAQSGLVMIHSAIGHWDTCLHTVRLPDSVLSIV